MKHVVNPPEALLDPEVPPLGLGHEVGLGDELGEVLGQHHVPVLELVVSVLVAVVNIFLGHYDIVVSLKYHNSVLVGNLGSFVTKYFCLIKLTTFLAPKTDISIAEAAISMLFM